MIDIKEFLDKEEKKVQAESKMLKDMLLLNGDNGVMQEYAQKLVADQVTINTWRNIFDKVMDNGTKNIALSHKKISALCKKYSAKTVLGVAFGPSLRKNIEELKRIKDKYVLVMADRGVDYLMQAGIRPRYIACMDAHIDPKYLGEHDLSGIDLISSIGTNHAFVKRFVELGGRDIYYLVTQDRLGIHNILIKEFGLDNQVVRIPGNVGNGIIKIALDVFYCKKLLLAGFDYAFDDWYYPDKKFSSDDAKETFRMIDINEEPCKSTTQLFLYAHWAGKAINECYRGFDRVINCTEGGILRLPKIGRLKDY